MKRKNPILFVFLLFLSSSICFPQSGWIQQSPLPTNLAGFSIKFINNNTGVSVGGFGTIIKTTNGGVNWEKINSNITNSLRYLVFINSNTGFAVGDSSIIIKTTNAGENWVISYNSNSKYAIHCIYFINDNIGYAYRDSSNEILKTTNCGNNWISINTDLRALPRFQSLFFFNENTGIFYYGYSFFKTYNGGINWISKDISPYSAICMHFFNQNTGIAAGIEGNVIKTTNGGENWSFLTQVSPISTLIDIRFLDSLNGYLFCGEVGITYRTTDKGNSWTALMGSGYAENIAFDFSDINTGYITFGTGRFIKTTNSGLNWNIISSGTMQPLYSIHFANLNTGFAVGSEEILKTTNGGNMWISVGSGGIKQSVHCYDTTTAIAISSGYVQKTTNGGLNWIVKDNSGSMIKASFINNFCYFAHGSILGKSTDAGETWTHINTGAYMESIFFINENTGFASVGLSSKIYKTINGGINWNLIFTGSYNYDINAIYFTDSLNGFAVVENGYFIKTTNGGYNWSHTVTGYGGFTSIQFINKNTGYLTCGGYVIKTTNSGQSWIAQNTGSTSGLNDIYFLDSNTGYVVGDLGVIYKTSSGGVWVKKISEQIPENYLLFQNYPNPFNPNTIIRFQIKDSRFTTLKIYNILGKEIETLVNEKLQQGTYEFQFDGSKLPSGVYFYRIQAGDFVQVKKMVLIK